MEKISVLLKNKIVTSQFGKIIESEPKLYF